ncbi:hypothetical protein [Bizionia sp.]|uniref:hypothetical protein n=1 Tax=Bizionia sp. TaxID=1954480 RepID=UPI003A92D8C0
MNYLNNKHINSTIVFIITVLIVTSCFKQHKKLAYQPAESDYTIGEKWVWKYKGVSDKGEVRSDGKDVKQIVAIDGVLTMLIGNDSVPVSNLIAPDKSETPRYKWPLEVGKKWIYERTWTSQDSTIGKQSQNAEVLSYKEEKVGAGIFMAYTIVYKGTISNSRGYSARTEEVWLYAPKVKNFIKLTQTQDDFVYNEELIEYTNPNTKQ